MKASLKLALLGLGSLATSAAFAQTINVAGPFDFVDTLTGPEAGLNSTVSGIAPVTTAYLFGSSAVVNTINLTAVLGTTYASEASARMVNSAFPTLGASVNFSTVTTYVTFSITSPTTRNFSANSLLGSNLPVASTWSLTFFESFEDGAGPDSTGDTLSMVPGVYVPPPPKTPWASVAGNTLPIIYDNGTIVNAPGAGAGGLDASTYGSAQGGTTFGFTSLAPTYKLADDFVVPAGGWTVTAVSAFAYQTNAVTTPFASCLVEIWNGDPSLPTSSVVATSTTNGDNVFSNVYRAGPTTLTSTARKVWRVQSLFSSVYLAPGTYWMSYQMNLASGTASFSPYVTLAPSQPAGIYPGNAIQRTAVGAPDTWVAASDAGAGAQTEIPFLIHGFAPPPNVNLTGTLTLGDTAFGGPYTRTISYAVKQGTTTVASGTTVRSVSSGSFSLSIPASATGAATIEWDGSSFLKRKTNVTLTGSNVAVGTVLVQNGDVDNSGEVDAADIDQVIADFGSTSDITSDVDVSGEVDAADIDIVIANFGGIDD